MFGQFAELWPPPLSVDDPLPGVVVDGEVSLDCAYA
jgi:hypothetical protein